MYRVSSELYRQVAERLSETVGSRDYFSGSVVGETAGTAWRLTVSVIVYRSRRSLPEGPQEPIADFVPVWWEFRTFAADGSETLNDFSFSEVRDLVRSS
ncbi:MAG: hypothetical protein K2I85_01335 [Alistipes sp.]|nr:hypothetical protein [Alistipes sp.]